MTPGTRWHLGEEKLQRAVEEVLFAAETEATNGAVLGIRDERRRLLRLRLPSGEGLVLKHFVARNHRHARRERLKNAVGLSTAARERRALLRLRAAGLEVPELRGLAVLPGGDRVLVTRELTGAALHGTLDAQPTGRRALLGAVGDLVHRLHSSGHVHGDLHAGNLWVTPLGPVLLDLGAVRRSRSQAARLRDLGALEHSLEALLSGTDLLRLRAAALGLQRPFDAAARQELRSVRRAAESHARRHFRSLTRRTLAPGGRFARARCGDAVGLRARGFPEPVLAALFEACRVAPNGVAPNGVAPNDGAVRVLKSDGRSRVSAGTTAAGAFIVKEWRPRGLRRRLRDAWRGSPARRAWIGGHGLLARGIGAARPAAYLETRRLGMTVASFLVLEDASGDSPADGTPANVASPEEVLTALQRLATQLHRRCGDHGDLKASHVYLGRREGHLEARLIDLEGVRFRRRLRDADRIRALAQLNASLPDDLPAALRCRAFEAYARALPFGCGSEVALARIARASLRRAHRWSGAGCAAAASHRRESVSD